MKGCTSKANVNTDLSFHTFPIKNKQKILRKNYFGAKEKIDQLKAWQSALKIYKTNSRMKVCSNHFNEEDYFLPGNYY